MGLVSTQSADDATTKGLRLEVYVGTTWSGSVPATVAVPDPSEYVGPSDSVSCAAVGSCLAVGYMPRMVEEATLTGGTWFVRESSRTFNSVGGIGASCVAASSLRCLTVGSNDSTGRR